MVIGRPGGERIVCPARPHLLASLPVFILPGRRAKARGQEEIGPGPDEAYWSGERRRGQRKGYHQLRSGRGRKSAIGRAREIGERGLHSPEGRVARRHVASRRDDAGGVRGDVLQEGDGGGAGRVEVDKLVRRSGQKRAKVLGDGADRGAIQPLTLSTASAFTLRRPAQRGREHPDAARPL